MPRKKKTSRPSFCGKQNIAGVNIKKIRKEKFPGLSQNGLAVKMQLFGTPMNKNKIQKIEAGICSVSDIELLAFSKALEVDFKLLLDLSSFTQYTENSDSGVKDIADLSSIYSGISYKDPEEN